MRQRSSYPKPFKAQVVQECLQPGAATSLPAFVPLKAAPKRPAEASVIIELPMAGQVITVKRPTSDPEDCAQFIGAVAQ